MTSSQTTSGRQRAMRSGGSNVKLTGYDGVLGSTGPPNGPTA